MSGRAAVQLGASASTPSARRRKVAPTTRTSPAASGGTSASNGSIRRSGGATRSRRTRLREHEPRRARAHARLAELAGELAERGALRFAGAGVGQEPQRLAREALAGCRPPIELWNDGASEREVGEADPWDAQHQPSKQLAHERETIADDHRRAEERRLERDGPRGDEPHVGRPDD